MASDALQMLGAVGQPFCRDYDVCAAGLDGGGLPLLPFVWGGNAANSGVYRTLAGGAGSPLAVGGAWGTAMRPPIQSIQGSIFGPSTPFMQGTWD